MLRLPAFTYLQPRTLQDALAMKADAGPDGMYVAGGTDLYPNMKRRHQEPRTVISLMGIPELRRLEGWTVGTCITLTELSNLPTFQGSYPAVAHAAGLVSTPLLRNMGTLGGNLCLDTRCNYYNQSYEWRKSIDFCMKKDGAICWVAPSCPRGDSTITTASIISRSSPTKSSWTFACPSPMAGTRSITSCDAVARSTSRCWVSRRGSNGSRKRGVGSRWCETRASCWAASRATRRRSLKRLARCAG